MKTLKTIIIFVVALLTTSCDDFLSEKPNKSSSIAPQTTQQLEYLLNGTQSTYQNETNETCVYGSDDYELISEMFDHYNAYYIKMETVIFGAWDIDAAISYTNNNFWTNEYKKIYTANLIQEYLSKVTGSEEDKERIKREASFIKAYSAWVLAQTYCLPYTEANKNEPGLIIKNTTGFQESFKRATLSETYDWIEENLTEALKTSTTLVKKQGQTPRIWRESKPAVLGFAARFYLNRNNYSLALEYAQKALTEYSELVNYNTEMRFTPTSPELRTVAGTTYNIYYPYTFENQDINKLQWKESYYNRVLYNGSGWYIPSSALINLYDKTYDLRYKYHFVKDFSVTRGSPPAAPYRYPGYMFFGYQSLPSGPSVAEMYLIESECLARLERVDEAMSRINILRKSRFSTNAPSAIVNLTSNSKDDAIKKILEERRRECPFTQRWYDLRRLNNNEDPNDDAGDITRSFYNFSSSAINAQAGLRTFTLSKNSRRYATPIPSTEIDASVGVTIQNQY